MSIVTGSTSRTPYMVCTRIGQNAPNVARNTSLRRVVPSVRKSSGMSAADGIGRRNSTGTRNARPAKSLRPSANPIGTARTVASASPSAQPRTVCRNALQKSHVFAIDPSSSTVEVIEGRSCSRMTPDCETSSQKTNANAIEAAKTSALTTPDDLAGSRVARRRSAVPSSTVVIRGSRLPSKGCARSPATAARGRV